MSHTATSDVTPQMNLDAFGYPPSRQFMSHSGLSTQCREVPPQKKRKVAKTPTTSTDDEDVFSLDMVTMDMGFEQAYGMYTQMQQKSALLGVEELQRAQQINMNNTLSHNHMRPAQSYLQVHDNQHLQDQNSFGSMPLLSPPGEAVEKSYPRAPALSAPGFNSNELHKRFADNHSGFPSYKNFQDLQKRAMKMSLPEQTVSKGHTSFQEQEEYEDDSHDELDHFFSSTESNALEKFLDNLASSNLANPLDLYNQAQPSTPQLFDLHTMGTAEQRLSASRSDYPDLVKNENGGGFGNQSSQYLPTFSSHNEQNFQLPTPNSSRQVSNAEQGKKTSLDDGTMLETVQLKKKKKTSKPLLSLEQKRLNHSHSEQRRRLLCKQAYERCLRLITNVDDYKNDLVSASALTSSAKKSKRKQINKDGLPNLSKHTALLKISLEIIKIRDKNEKLQELIAGYR